jgi:hypothetical protein
MEPSVIGIIVVLIIIVIISVSVNFMYKKTINELNTSLDEETKKLSNLIASNKNNPDRLLLNAKVKEILELRKQTCQAMDDEVNDGMYNQHNCLIEQAINQSTYLLDKNLFNVMNIMQVAYSKKNRDINKFNFYMNSVRVFSEIADSFNVYIIKMFRNEQDSFNINSLCNEMKRHNNPESIKISVNDWSKIINQKFYELYENTSLPMDTLNKEKNAKLLNEFSTQLFNDVIVNLNKICSSDNRMDRMEQVGKILGSNINNFKILYALYIYNSI